MIIYYCAGEAVGKDNWDLYGRARLALWLMLTYENVEGRQRWVFRNIIELRKEALQEELPSRGGHP